jgi:hypothetical protein
MIIILKALILSVVILCFMINSASSQNHNDRLLIGLEVSVVLKKLKLKTGEEFVIDEPPCIPRGIEGITPDGDTVEIYIKRGDLPFDEKRNWKLSEFKSKTVVGIARYKNNRWYVTGDVIMDRVNSK